MVRKIVIILLPVIFIMAGPANADSKDVAAERVKSADWTKMETVTVKMSEFVFTPSTLTFKKDTPYRLRIENAGKNKHYFVSEDFFQSIATRKAQSSDGEIKAPYFTAIEVFPGRSIDLYFIPLKEGEYRLTCTIQGHTELGMTGNIVVK